MQHHGGTSNETTAAATNELTDLMGRSVEATGHAGQVHLKPPVRASDHAANGGRRSPSPTRSGLSSSATDGGAMWTCSLDVAEHESPSALYTSTLRTSHHAVRVDVASDRTIDAEKAQACNLIIEALQLRKKYLFVPKVPEWERPDAEEPFQPDWEGELPSATSHTFKCVQGVFHAYDNEEAMAKDEPSHDPILPLVDFHRDYHRLLEICNAGPVKTFSYERLKVLEYRWHFHSLLNAGKEILSSQTDDPKDFSNVAKVDTHIHLAAAMTSKHLLSFIKRKIRDSPNDEVLTDKEGKPLTLQQFISTLGLKIDEFTVDSLDVRADNTFNRFEIFNSKYSPFGFSELRTIFMKTENMQDGRYFAELTKELCSKLEVSECCFAEWRVSVYGSKRSDWDNLAKWVVSHRVYSDHNRWIVQVPRIYNIFKKAGQVKHFQEFLDNILSISLFS
ncbi:AMP deaminase [Balamuthia mandrillaris]